MKMTAGSGSGEGRMQNSKMTGALMKKKNMKKADLNKDGKLSGYEKKTWYGDSESYEKKEKVSGQKNWYYLYTS